MKKLVSLVLLTALLLQAALPVSAESLPSAGSPKEEVVYAILGQNGSLESLYVVNVLEVQNGLATDYGAYTALRNMTTNDPLQQQGEAITIATNARRISYEGKLEGRTLPWDISVRYFLDGQEYTAQQVAGQSGSLRIAISIRENPLVDSHFFKNYALQASLSLDTTLFQNIVAEGATLANVGSKKQLTYTILPGKGKEIEITANVQNFAMDAITLNGLQLALDFDMDTDELTNKVSELVDALRKLDDGALQLRDGAGELQDGGDELKEGTDALRSGARKLDRGVRSLYTGIVQVQDGLKELQSKSPQLVQGSAQVKKALQEMSGMLGSLQTLSGQIAKLVEGSADMQAGISGLVSALGQLEQGTSPEAYAAFMADKGLDIDDLQQRNMLAIAQYSGEIAALQAQLATASDADKPALQAQIDKLEELVELLKDNQGALLATQGYLVGVSAKVGEIAAGAGQLESQYTLLDTAIGQLAAGLGAMGANLSLLSSGSNAGLLQQYEALDTGINAYTQAVAEMTAQYKYLVEGAADLVTGSEKLANSTRKLDNGTATLLDAIDTLYDATGTLQDGTHELQNKTGDMDSQITDKIDSMLGGNVAEGLSFVSPQNTNVRMLQFVMRTAPITVPKTEKPPVEEQKPLSFREKLLRLFGRS